MSKPMKKPYTVTVKNFSVKEIAGVLYLMSVQVIGNALMLHLHFEAIKCQNPFVYLIHLCKEGKEERSVTCQAFLQLELYFSGMKSPNYKLYLTKLIPLT